MIRLTRRTALTAGAALPLAATLPLRPVHAEETMRTGNARKNSFMLGDFEVTTLLAGTRTVEDPQSTFGMNVSAEAFADASRANFLPHDRTQFFFTPTLVSTGSEVVLFDAGLSAEGTLTALEQAGYASDEVTVVILTHMHGDHIGGLVHEDGTPTFANARYVAGQVEFDHWAMRESEAFEARVRPISNNMTFIDGGETPVNGITAIEAFGHTPGHMVFMLESGDRRLLVFADTANHHVWSLAHPDWEVRFDADKAVAAETRRRILGMLAADRIPFIGYHMPFPALGYVEDVGGGRFRYVPATYQMML